MKQRNCPNCGAPYEVDINKCPYCGTSYYDLSALDLTKCEPFYLKIKTEFNGQPCYITQLVRPSANLSLECSTETTDVYDALGYPVCSYISNRTLTTNLTFEAVCSPTHKNLFTIEMEG